MIARCVNCLRSIYRHRTTEFDEPLRQRLQDLAKKLRIRRVPRIIVSDVLFGPAVLGLWRYTIVLPRCLLQTSRSFLPERIFAEGEPARSESKNAGLPVDTACTQVAASREVLPGRQDQPKPLPGRQDLQFLDPILAHELLHIRRGDLRTGTLQALVQSLWWFHPAVWLCNRWLSREAERCCDEQVIAELGCSPAQYARSLLSVIESKHQLQPVPVFPGMKPVEITSQRMERIMSLKTGLQKQTPLW
jgi:beta-lactamase regulating signal transducer with metallopeptidase domain